jgi:MEDS: MEthanogen/methylotroph, DcmR Sensory domain
MKDQIPLGITDDQVALGSHLIHFWQNEEEFERGVRFLEPGIENESQYCVLIGHDEANQRVLEVLRKTCSDLDRVLREGRLIIVGRESSASAMLTNIDAAFAAVVRKGATVIRCLGTFGKGEAPGRGAYEQIELENGATALARRYPCVFVCMFDINEMSGWLVLNAGFGSHLLVVSKDALRQSPYFAPDENALRARQAAQ